MSNNLIGKVGLAALSVIEPFRQRFVPEDSLLSSPGWGAILPFIHEDRSVKGGQDNYEGDVYSWSMFWSAASRMV